MTKEALEAIISRMEVWALIFGVIVLIGVAGESVFGVRIWWNNRKLHKLEQSENDELKLKISQADERSKQSAIDLNTAKSDLSSKQLELAQEQRRTAEAQEKAAKAQLELHQSFSLFVNRSGVRVLKAKELTESLAGRPKKKVEVWYKDGDPEARRFSADIFRAFDAAGWPVSIRPYKDDEKFDGQELGKIRGIIVASGDPSDQFDMKNGLLSLLLGAQLLGGAGIGETPRSLPRDTVVIIVGPEIGM